MENSAGRVSFFSKVFWACLAAAGGFALLLSAEVLLFANKLINLPVFCLALGVSAAGAAAGFHFLLKKIFAPIKIQSKQSQKIEAVGYLASGFSHEYNNMFAVVLGAAEVLQTSVKKEYQEYIDIIISTTQRASLLTNQLFGSARKKKIEMIAVDMHQTLHSVIGILMKNRTPNIYFHENFQAESWNVVGNQQQIKNALINLGITAIEAIGSKKKGSVFFRTYTTEFSENTQVGIFTIEAGNYFTISIEDTSDGFSPAQMEKIFDPYFSASNNKPDLGIRLASVLATISHHNGAILAQSKENHGTTFTIYLPFSGRNFERPTTILRVKNDADENRNLTIMVVDDDPLVRKVVVAMLNRIGYSVIIAASGLDAIEIYNKNHEEIALVILDMVMPNMDGVACFYELKKINDNVKVIISSGLIDNSSIEDMEKDGLCGFITKPYSYAELEKVVANTLQI